MADAVRSTQARAGDMPPVAVSGVRKRYGRIEALRGVDLGVRSGEIFGLLGPNGAGKTTLIRTLVGSSKPDAGSVRVLGLDPYRRPLDVRPQIGYMPQAPALYEELSPRDNLWFFGRAHAGCDLRRRVDEALELIGLSDRASDPVYGLSGGMKQRVSLACALLHRPRVLLLDEPTAGVDPRLRESFWRHFRALAAEGAALLVSTHQMDEALLCDRLAVLRDGRVLVCETPKALFARGRTHVRLRRGDDVAIERTLEDATVQLPRWLREFGLDPAIDRIEVEPDALDTILLELIAARGARPGPEGAGGGGR
jgi:ABC-2 type transport system ATP-binding protein